MDGSWKSSPQIHFFKFIFSTGTLSPETKAKLCQDVAKNPHAYFGWCEPIKVWSEFNFKVEMMSRSCFQKWRLNRSKVIDSVFVFQLSRHRIITLLCDSPSSAVWTWTNRSGAQTRTCWVIIKTDIMSKSKTINIYLLGFILTLLIPINGHLLAISEDLFKL